MDNSHCREIHYHLARALMHLNSLAGFLPFFEPAVDWEDHEADFYRRPSLPSPHHRRHLHTFVPIPPGPSSPSLSSHGGMPTHMALNPSQTYGPCQFAEVQIPLKTVDQQMPPFGWDHLPPSIQALRHLSLHDHHLGRQISTGPGKSSLTLCTVGTLSGTTKILSQPPSPSLDRC